MMGREFFLTSSLLVMAAAAAPAMAQGTAQSGAAPAGLNDIVVTAQRRAERLQDVPLTITAVSSKTLERAGVATLRDLTTVVAGFTYAGQGSNGQPAIRGVSTQVSAAGSELPNALYVDGIYFGAQSALNANLPDIERIEVLKGPQGTLFGRNATGGAIQIFTRNPSFTPSANFTIDVGQYFKDSDKGSVNSPRINARGFVNIPLVDDFLALSLSGGRDYTQGYFRNVATGRQDGVIRKSNARAKLLIAPADNVEVILGAYYIKNSGKGQLFNIPYKGLTAAAQYPGSIVPTRPYEVAYDTGASDVQKDMQRTYGFNGKVTIDLDAGTLTSLTGYNNNIQKDPNTSVHGAQAALPCLFNFACIDYNFTPYVREYSQELNFASRKFGIFSFVGGLFFYDAKGGTIGRIQGTLASFAPPGTFPITVQNTRFRTKAYAAYGEATIEPTDQLSVILGLRGTIEPHSDNLTPTSPTLKKTFRALTPRLTAKYTFSPEFNAYATYSQGYRSGLTGVTNTQSVPPFAPVKPEKLYNYEVGMKYGTRDLTLNLSAFYYDYKDKQEQTFTGTGSVIANTGPVRIYGLDLDTNVRLTDALSFRGNVSYIPYSKYRDFPNASGQSTVPIPFDPSRPPFNCAPGGGCGGYFPGVGTVVTPTFDASGQRLIRAPKVTASGTLAYETDHVDVSATAFYSSKVYHDITQTIVQKGYATLAAQAAYKFDGGLRVGVYGRNLTNKTAIANGLTSASGFLVGFIPPRELGITLGYSY